MANGLPHLPEVERLSPRVIRVLGGNPSKFTLQGTNTYLLGTGACRLLLDTGEGLDVWAAAMSSILSSQSANISHALLTHRHKDHVSGVQQVRAMSPRASIHKHSPSHGQVSIQDGQIFQVEGATLHAFHCPGHTSDHVAFILEEEDAMFTGDNVLGHGTAVFEDLATYLNSLERMRERFGGRAYPGHGAVIEAGKAKISDYIEHRKEREKEILQALEGSSGDTKVKEIVAIVYKDYATNLHEAAAKGVVQVLWKLEAEGKVKNVSGEEWKMVGQPTL